MGYVKLTGSANRHEDWTSEYVLERDEETGEVTKVVRAGEPIQLEKSEQEKLEALGAVFEDSSAEEAKEFEASREEAPLVGADVASAAPLLGSQGTRPNQSAEPPVEGDKANRNK